MEPLRIGLIGAGDVASAGHMPSFTVNPKVQVTVVADPNTESAQALAERYGIEKVVEDYREILDDSSINAVDICVPHHLHYPIMMDSLNAGKHVICDKPIAMTLEEADRMIEAAHELGLWLLVVLNERFLPVHRKVKELIDDGTLGTPFLVNALATGNMLLRMNDASDWLGTWDRAGGGAFFTTGVHLVDLMNWWFGKPSKVTGTLKRLLVNQENKADDNAVVTLEYDDNLIANLVVSYSVENEPWSERKFIYGSGGDISIINESGVPMFLMQNGMPQALEVEHKADWWSWSIDLALRHLVDCIMEGAEPLVTDEDARAALEVVLVAYGVTH